jgi:hypothetical protein
MQFEKRSSSGWRQNSSPDRGGLNLYEIPVLQLEKSLDEHFISWREKLASVLFIDKFRKIDDTVVAF